MYLDHVTDMMLKGLGRQVYAMGVNIVDSIGSILLVLYLLPRLGAPGYVLVILLAEIFNFSLSITGLSGALPFRFPYVKGVLLPVCAVLLAVTAVRFLIPVTGVPSLILALALSLLLYCLLLFALLALFRKKGKEECPSAHPPLDNPRTFGYNKSEKIMSRAGKGE
jgi:Na+-driven multidrug efflux pump